MLVIANGAYKSGSSWLYTIVRELVGGQRVPEAYQFPRWRHSALHPDRVAAFLDEVDFRSQDFLAKNHLARPDHRELLANRESVRLLNITRDLRDVLVSAYHHESGKDAPPEGFAEFFDRRGKTLLEMLTRYHALWNKPAENIYVSSYVRLKGDFEAEVRAIAQFLGAAVSDADIARIAAATDIRVKQQGPDTARTINGRRYVHRKGVVGDHVNYFDERVSKAFERIAGDAVYQ